MATIDWRRLRASSGTSMPTGPGTNSAHCTGSPAARLRSTASTSQSAPRGGVRGARARGTEAQHEDVHRHGAHGKAGAACGWIGIVRPVLTEQHACSCTAGRPRARGDRERALGGEGDPVQPGRHGIGVGHAPVHSGRARAAQEDLAAGDAPPRLEEDAPRVRRARRGERAGLRVERHDHDQHQRMHAVARHDVERRALAQDAPIVQPDHDVGHDLHRGRAQGAQRRLEVLHRPLEVVDLADGRLRADHVHHRGVDARRFHRLRARAVEQRRVDRDLEVREIALQALDRGVVALVADLVGAVRSPGEQEAAQRAAGRHRAHRALERFRSARGDHRLEDLRPAVLAHQGAGARGDGERGKCVAAAAAELAARVRLEGGRGESDLAPGGGGAGALALGEELRVELRPLELLHGADAFEPAHRARPPAPGPRAPPTSSA